MTGSFAAGGDDRGRLCGENAANSYDTANHGSTPAAAGVFTAELPYSKNRLNFPCR
ncbi:MAG: hypothetical protein IT440_03135 [Phycisphaeraceae bacterium]|nr:hypothetical protein [Phycisphaeraceae bacterium]